MGASLSVAVTLVGGNHSADGNDCIISARCDFIFGNGDNDTIASDAGANTVVGGQGGDSVLNGTGTGLIFANQGNAGRRRRCEHCVRRSG
jgi:hypothetical protein